MKLLKIFFSVLFLTFLSCSSDDDNCDIKKIKTDSIENLYACENPIVDLENEPNEGGIHLVQSNKEFEELGITKNCDFEIDFDKYDLIIGISRQLPDEVILYESCTESSYHLSIITIIGTGTTGYKYYFNLLIPKNSLNEKEFLGMSNVLRPKKQSTE